MLPCPKVLTLKVGAQVILTKRTSAAKGLVNGSRGVVTGFHGLHGPPVVKFKSGVEVMVPPETWSIVQGGVTLAVRKQLPLDLAWGISIHKSQVSSCPTWCNALMGEEEAL